MTPLLVFWNLFTLAVFISTVVFFQTELKGKEQSIPDLNQQYFDFLYISYWIIIGMYGLAIVLAAGFGVVAAADMVPSLRERLEQRQQARAAMMTKKK